ncbi:MAG: ISKra4 family transposase, partial [Chloroflexota bacterium]
MSLQFKLQLVVVAEDGAETTEELLALAKDHERLEHLGLTLAEGKQLLREVQRRVLERQVQTFLATQATCPDCGRERGTKDHKPLDLRTLFGKITLESPRLRQCCRQPGEAASLSPLTRLLSERSTPELQYMETRWASLVSYGLTVQALHDFLPVDEHLSVSTVRRTTLGVAQRLDDELGAEQPMFIDGCQAQWDDLPRPDLPLVVGLDGGYVHASQQRSRRDGWFEVIAGKSMPAEGPAKCFGFVQTYDTKPKRRLFEVLRSQGMQMNQQVTFLTDGGEDVRELPLYLNPQAEHLLDWFHITMRLTVMGQYAKSLP